MNKDRQKVVISEQASFTELLENQEGVILNLENLYYYTLNSSAVFLWKTLRSQAAPTAKTLSQHLVSAFSISPAQAEADTQAFLSELSEYSLISYSPLSAQDKLSDVAQASVGTLPAYEAPQFKLSSSLLQVTLSGSSTISPAIGGS